MAFLGVVGAAYMVGKAVVGEKTEVVTKQSGMIAIAFRIINPDDGLLLDSFHSSGQITTSSLTTSKSSLGKTETKTESASSAIGQAIGAAMNDASTQIHRVIVGQAALVKR
jgi:hypothetical protein